MKSGKTMWLWALFCCFLWGSAPAFISSGTRWLHLEGTGQILQFAGWRFFLAGVLVLLFHALKTHSLPQVSASSWKYIGILALLQTFGQYFFYYIGIANSSAMMASVLSGTSALLALAFSAWVFHLENMTIPKLAGCLLGLAGIIVMNLNGLQFQFSPGGEGMILASQVCSALSAVCIQIFSKKESPVLLSGYQFVLGGAGLILCGLMQAPAFSWNAAGALDILWLALVSAGAYTIWGILLSRFPVSSVGIFGCTIPLFGIVFSFLFLSETLHPEGMAAALLIVSGTVLVNINFSKKEQKKHLKDRKTI